LNILIKASFYLPEPSKVITVKEDSDVVLPCSLSTKNITSELFDWRKVAQKNEVQKEVYMYDNGTHYNSGLDGQSEEFKGRVSHFQDELKHGNASIIIRNTKISDSGDYSCDFPKLQTPQTFYVKLVVERVLKDRSGENIPGAAPKPLIESLKDGVLQCKVHGNPTPEVGWRDRDGNVLRAKVTERGDGFNIILQTTVKKSGIYCCVATQEEIKHQIYAETNVYISGLSPGWIVLIVVGVVAGVVCLNVGVVIAGAVFVKKGYITLYRIKGTKVIKVEEGSDVILPFYVQPKKDITSKVFIWRKRSEAGGKQKNVLLYDKDVLNKGQSEEVKGQDKESEKVEGQDEQFRGRVEYFQKELKEGNASITIRKITMADSGKYICIYQYRRKPQTFKFNLVVVEPKVITVEEGSDVNGGPEENLRLKEETS
ncbi:V-set and immunoglobulin domain-containing protein 1, partial [Etheostoma spectabile]|uniref:V-set and immunoglobulin domain-containing protein 1 n=1 Tax=Etheostoma spectabile TaxID=54343 RepID=UPI0013AEC125